jgi:RsbT co-antagonist protein rsbRD N-terminal domain
MLDRWFARAVECHSAETIRLLGAEKDPFRNPVGHTLRQNLAVLLEQLLGEMEPEPAQAALANIVQIRAVQDMTASQAVQFVFQLRPILRQFPTEANPEVLDHRIDQLALWAFEEYVRCRERLADIRISESRRGMGVAAARRQPALTESGLKAGLKG